jgi:O-antigen ligase
MNTSGTAAWPLRSEERSASIVAPLRWALCAMTFSLALEFPERFPVEVSTIAGSTFLLCTLFHPARCYGWIPEAVAWFWLSLYVMLVALVFSGATYPGGLYLWDVTQYVLLLLLWILVFWVCSNLFEDERLARVALWALVAGCLIRSAMPLLGIGTTATPQGLGGERVTVLGQGPNQSAQVLAVGLIALIGLTEVQRRRPGRLRLLAWAGIALITGGLVATGSRGGLTTFAAGLMVILLTGRTLRARLRNAAVAVAAAGLLTIAFARSDLLQRRFSQAVEEGNLAGREQIYPLSVAMFLEKPLLGWGPITNKYELGARLGDGTHQRRDAHNAILEILTACGIVGLIPFAFGVWLCLRSAWLGGAEERGVLPLALVVGVIVVNMSGNRLTAPITWLMLSYGLTSRRRPQTS